MAESSSTQVTETVVIHDPNYVDPVEDPYNKAISYLEKHNILQLFQVASLMIPSIRSKHVGTGIN